MKLYRVLGKDMAKHIFGFLKWDMISDAEARGKDDLFKDENWKEVKRARKRLRTMIMWQEEC